MRRRDMSQQGNLWKRTMGCTIKKKIQEKGEIMKDKDRE
jgi:hypothetical protein